MSTRKIFILLTAMLTILITSTMVLHAWDPNDHGSGGVTTEGKARGGASYMKTGYLICITDESGNPLVSPMAIATFGNYDGGSASLISHLGYSAGGVSGGSIVWGFAPFDKNGHGCHGALDNYMTTPQGGFDEGATYVTSTYWGLDEDGLQGLKDGNGKIFLNVEPFMWANVYTGNYVSDEVFCGTSVGWAQKSDGNSRIGIYTHGNLPNSIYYKSPLLGLSSASPKKKYSSGEISGSVGLGIGTYELLAGDKQLIKVYRTAGVVDATVYGTCDKTYVIQNEGDYEAKDWKVGTQKTKLNGKHDYPDFTDIGNITQTGYGPGVVTMIEKEKVLVILYEREEAEIPELNKDALKAHELCYVFPFMEGDREAEEYTGRQAYTMSEVVDGFMEELAEDVSGYSAYPKNQNIEYREDSFYVIEDHEGALMEKAPVWCLYREEDLEIDWNLLPTFKDWGKFLEKWQYWSQITPHYSFYLSRSLGEDGVVLCNYRETAGNNATIQEITDFEEGDEGKVRNNGCITNVEMPIWEGSTTFSFIATCKVDYQHRDVIDPGYDPIFGITGELIDPGHEDVMSDWEDKTETLEDEIETKTIGHVIEAYKTYPTDTAVTGAFENQYTEYMDNDLGLPVVRRDTVVTNLLTPMTIWPEVLMTYWYGGFGEWIEPEEVPVYVMGEYERMNRPPMVHGYVMSTDGTNGIGLLSTPSTGEIANNIPRGEYDAGVTAMGTAFTVGTDFHLYMDVYSVGFDVLNSKHPEQSLKWGNNDAIDTQASHDAYCAELLKNTQYDLKMLLCNKSGEHVGLYDLISDEYEFEEINDAPQTAVMFLKEGGVWYEGADPHSYLNQLYSAGGDLYEGAGLDTSQIFDTMFESCSDDDNASGNEYSEESIIGRFRWYDEEVDGTVTITLYHTRFIWGDLMSTDKMDYNWLNQGKSSAYENSNDYLIAHFYSVLEKMPKDDTTINVDGSTFPHTGYFYVQHLDNTRMAIENVTTNQLQKSD